MALLSALGIGALVGVIVQQVALLYHGHKQHQRELELKRIDIQEHRRDERLHRLREDLKELMFALFEIERALNLFHAGHARAAGETHSPEALQVIERLTQRREAARAGLLLDPDGEKLYELFHAVLDKLSDAQAKARYMQQVVDERGFGPELNQRLDEFYQSVKLVRQDLRQTVEQAQRLLGEITR